MKSRTILLLALLTLALVACDKEVQERQDTQADDTETPPDCSSCADGDTDEGFDGFVIGSGTSGEIGPPGGSVEVTGADQGDLEGARVEAMPNVLTRTHQVTISGTDDIVPEGYIALSPALFFESDLPYLGGWVHFTLPFRPELMPENAKTQSLQIFAKRANKPRVFTAPFPDLHEDIAAKRVTYRAQELVVYQIGIREDAGQTYQRRLAYRSITGVSMGAGGAMMIAMRHPDLFDSVGALGGAADWVYLQHYLRDHGLGGFCKHPNVGELCPGPETTEENEISMTYETWHSPSGDGNGGTFDRSEYVRIFRDLSMAFGNTAMYNPDSPYRPAGMPRDELLRSAAERCAETPENTFTIETGYYDDEYNPDGSLPVIAFCDSEDGNPRGDFDDSQPHTMPTEVTLAVDVNGNGRRDSGEPVLRNSYEPYQDLGPDGLASADEPDYNADTNPDPNDDDYHWLTNPSGTEGNWLYDEGEPYDDFGLDGVENTASSPYDYGEGNGQFDNNPNLDLFFDERSPRHRLLDLEESDLDRLSLYVDGGIRDLFNFDVSGTHFVGALQNHGGNVRMYDKFTSIGQVEQAGNFDVTKIDFLNVGKHVFLRYGNPDASEILIEDGDGKHVGSNSQAVRRFITMFGFVTNLWPTGNYDVVEPPYSFVSDARSFESQALGGATVQYGINLPPDYDAPEFADVSYPVIYLLHGYGQGPEDLPVTGVLLAGYQAGGIWPKAIIVYPEGFCGSNEVRQCNDGIDNDGDGLIDFESNGSGDPECGDANGANEGTTPVSFCNDGVDNDGDGFTDFPEDKGCVSAEGASEGECVKGNFFTDHVVYPDGEAPGPQFEAMLLELIEHIDGNFRTKAPEEITWTR